MRTQSKSVSDSFAHVPYSQFMVLSGRHFPAGLDTVPGLHLSSQKASLHYRLHTGAWLHYRLHTGAWLHYRLHTGLAGVAPPGQAEASH